MKVKELLNWGKKELRAVPVTEPAASAEFLLRQVLSSDQRATSSEQGVNRAQFFAMLDAKVSPLQEKLYRKYIERRKKHEPVWQIVGKVQFWGLDFFVNQDVLVPRPETEFLVEQILKQVANSKKQVASIIDIGTGAGPIIISLAREMMNSQLPNTNYQFFASDVSEKALAVAKRNAKANGIADKIEFIQADLFEPIASSQKLSAGKFDVVTANLPYIPHEDLGGLALEIHHYEPRVSLDGGEGGLVIYEEFLRELPKHLNPSGMAFCEIGKDQGIRFCGMAKKYLPKAKCQIIKDLAGFDRISIIGA